MPPRKKRGVTRRGGSGRGRAKKIEPLLTEEPNVAEINALAAMEEPTSPAEESSSIGTPPAEAHTIKNHKSFGKYRYLQDNSNNSANTKSGESETDEVVFLIEEADDGHDFAESVPAIVNESSPRELEHEAHYINEDVIVYENSEVIETTEYEVATDQEEAAVVSVEDGGMNIDQDLCEDSQKSSESMFEVMCIVEDDSSATASAQNSEIAVSGGDDVLSNDDDEKINQIPEEIARRDPDIESELFIIKNAENTEFSVENVAEKAFEDANFGNNTIVANDSTECYPNTSEIVEKDHDSIENNVKVMSETIEQYDISGDYDNNVKQSSDIVTLESLVDDLNKSNSNSEHCAEMDLDISQPECSNIEMTTQNLQVLLSKNDSIDTTVDKFQEITLTDDPIANDAPKMQEIDAGEEPLSASKILKKKGRPRKTQSQEPAEKPSKSSPRKPKAEKKTAPDKVEKSDGEEQDDGASAFVKALELADKAAKKKIAKQKEAKAKKIDRAKKFKQLNKANKKAAALIAADKSEEDDENSIRRSSRIKTITNIKKASRGKGLVKSKSLPDIDTSDNSNSAFTDTEKTSSTSLCQESPTFASPTFESGMESGSVIKPVKVKSRWRRSSELEMIHNNSSHVQQSSTSANSSPVPLSRSSSFGADSGISVSAEHLPVQMTVQNEEQEAENKLEVERRLKQFIHLKENQYLTERISCKEAKKMTCDCFLTDIEIGRGEFGCGDDCLNRLLMIECGSLCAVSERCTNKRFQKGQFAPCEAFNTEKKGLGIRAAANIPYGEFILEYVGEVLDPDKFDTKAAEYSQDKNRHYYFMALRADAIIDATQKGNISRFINHSCDPNAETQKWTVNGELRIGFFSKRTILAGEEITFDYQFQRYGKEAQKCFCDAANCRGWLGEEPDDGDEDEDDEDEDDDEETEDKDMEDKQDVKKGAKKEISDESPKKEPKKRSPKKERVIKKKPRKEFFEDLDLDAEIETLQTTGLKNQAHTLKLSRLMVRSKEPAQRTKLLRLLRRGEFPCRRLFLDYHGLRLIHGWMTDAQQLAKQDNKMESLRLEILQTIATLPIPNKTMLQDSKVLSTVEKWSIADKTIGNNSPEDSESNSPIEQEYDDKLAVKTEVTAVENIVEGIVPLHEPDLQKTIENQTDVGIKIEKSDTNEETDIVNEPAEEQLKTSTDEDDIRHSVGMADYITPAIEKAQLLDTNRSIIEELTNMFSDDEDMDISPSEDFEEDTKKEVLKESVCSIIVDIKQEAPVERQSSTSQQTPVKPATDDNNAYNIITEIVALALKLLEEWAGLKEVFRIPKRERIEQMKEHEREANKNLSSGGSSKGGSALGEGGCDTAGVTERRMDSCRYRHLQGKVGYHIISGGRDYKTTDDRLSRKDDIRGLYDNKTQRGGALSSYSPRITKLERRKQFTLHLEHEESERRRRQRELWHQHEQHCLLMGTDPRFTAPYDPARGAGYHCIWNPATGQWQNYTTPQLGNAVGAYQTVPMVLPPLPYQEKVQEMEEVAKVKFMGSIPSPVQLPPKWKCAKDKYGRPYYYHIRVRKGQWEPPPINNDTAREESSSTTSSSDTSSLSSTSSEEDSETDDETSDTKLLIEIRNKFNRMDAQKRMEQEKQQKLEMMKAEKLAQSKILADVKKAEPSTPPTPINTEEESMDENDVAAVSEECKADGNCELDEGSTETEGCLVEVSAEISSLDKRLKDELGFLKNSAVATEETPPKKKRPGLVKEYIISPRSEKDKEQFREDLKKYKENKEMLRKQKEMILEKSKQRKSSSSKQKVSKHKLKKTVKLKLKKISDSNSEAVKRIKETFRSAMATVMVSILNSYRKPDYQFGRITNTDDFKHLARKLTHFVMLKELKHCKSIEDLICTDSVKSKAKEFVRKYMSKFGEVYVRPKDDIETYL